jgi:hypothetical protein
MAIDEVLARKGKDEPREGLVEQANVQVGLGKKYATQLGQHGWPAANTTRLEQDLAELNSARAKQVDGRDQAQLAGGGGEQRAVQEAKDFIAKLRLAATGAVQRAQEAGVKDASVKQFNSHGKLGRKTPALLDYLNNVSAVVTSLDAYLKPYFDGQSPAALLKSTQEALSAADVKHDVDVKGLPADTLQVYEAKGRVLSSIEELNRVGRIAFHGQAELSGQFNKDLLLRARRARKKTPDAPQ